MTHQFAAVILASGAGTLAGALLDAQSRGELRARVVALGADRSSPAIKAASAQGVATFTVRPADFPSRVAWDEALAMTVGAFNPDLIICAGFMRILGPVFVRRFGDRVINSHPSLLPQFPGAHAVADALSAGANVTGCTVHQVDLGVDSGPVLDQRLVPIEDQDSVAELHERIKVQERTMLVDVVNRIAEGTLVLTPGPGAAQADPVNQ